MLKILKDELIHILLDCGLGDSAQRKSVLAHVSDEITQRIIEGDTPLINVSYLVAKCLEFEDGIEQLAYAVLQVCGKTQYWQQLDQCIQKHYPKVVSYAERKDLLTIIGELPQSLLMHAYSLSKPEGYPVPALSSTSDIPEIILSDLTKMGRQMDDTFPILTFLEHLAWYTHEHGQEGVGKCLQSWVDMKAIALHLSDSQLAHLRQKVQENSTSRTEQAAYLLIMLDAPDTLEESDSHGGEPAYNVQFWLLDNQYRDVGTEIHTGLDDTSHTLDDLRLLLGHVLEQCLMMERLIDVIDDLVIEFLVPDELLNYHFDSWQVTIGDDELILGMQYRVVMRSIRRATKPIYWPAWRKKWAHLRCILADNSHAGHLACICSRDGCQVQSTSSCTALLCSQVECHIQKRLHAALRGSPTVCLALAHVPPSPSTNGNHVFGTLYTTGTPIAIWPRERSSDVNVLASLLTDESLASLPQKVWECRNKAVLEGKDDHIGHHLVLLWDNPDHLPPTVTAPQFSAPARKG